MNSSRDHSRSGVKCVSKRVSFQKINNSVNDNYRIAVTISNANQASLAGPMHTACEIADLLLSKLHLHS